MNWIPVSSNRQIPQCRVGSHFLIDEFIAAESWAIDLMWDLLVRCVRACTDVLITLLIRVVVVVSHLCIYPQTMHTSPFPPPSTKYVHTPKYKSLPDALLSTKSRTYTKKQPPALHTSPGPARSTTTLWRSASRRPSTSCRGRCASRRATGGCGACPDLPLCHAPCNRIVLYCISICLSIELGSTD